ncbi:hypothetical protein KR054_009203 [Drosophila jambulina]|nr:hypothetical protein KR054_009203 [Drosophila jambulina]
MENRTKKFRILVKRIHIEPEAVLTEEHKEIFIDFEKENRVLLMKLKASHTLWQEMSGKLNAISLEKGPREPPQWRTSVLNWRNRVMSKNTKKENLSPVDTAAKDHWEQPC